MTPQDGYTLYLRGNAVAVYILLALWVALLGFTLHELFLGSNFSTTIFRRVFGDFLGPLMLIGLAITFREIWLWARCMSTFVKARRLSDGATVVEAVVFGSVTLINPNNVTVGGKGLPSLIIRGRGQEIRIRSYMLADGAENARDRLRAFMQG